MKNLTIPIIFLLFGSMKIVTAQTPLYFNIVSHNEISDPLNYRDSVSHFNYIRSLIKELCDTIIAKQAKYNMQVDGNFINGVLTWENGATNANDILEWANNSPYIDVDGHNHFNPLPDYADVPNHTSLHNPYKYPDLAKLLDSCGLVPSHNILGGITYADTTVGNIVLQENWTQYSSPTPGYTFTNYFWQADIVWGTATPSHIADYTHFGIWKPEGASSPTQFGTHDPNAAITHVGGGCKEDVSYILDGNLVRTTDEVIANIKAIADGIQTLPNSANDFYTMNMLINFRDIPQIPSFSDSLAKIIDGIQDYVNQGKIVWATLGEKYDLWYQQHTNPNDYFNVDCADVPLITSVPTETNIDKISIYPNPSSDYLFLNNPDNISIKKVEIFNLLGEKLNTLSGSIKSIDISKINAGLLIVKVHSSTTIATFNIIKN